MRQRSADDSEVLRAIFKVLGVIALCVAAGNGMVAAGDGLLDRLVAVETGCEHLCPPPDTTPDLEERIDLLATQARPSVRAAVDPRGRVQDLNRFVFEGLGIRASQDLKDPDNLFLGRVLDRKQGYCVGIASLYLVLAEKLGLPTYAVATPSHVFLRYDDGVTRINIETLQGGANVPDEQYVREEQIPEESVRKGVFMQPLSAEEFLAQVHNNLGVIYSEKGMFEPAAEEYRRAIRLAHRFPAPYYNDGNDRLKQGKFRQAARRITKSLRLYPTDVWALNNRGLAYSKMGKLAKARRDFEEAIRIDPGFEAARKNLERLAESP